MACTHTHKKHHNKWSTYICDEQRDVQMIWKNLMYLIMSNVHLLKQVKYYPPKELHKSQKKTHVNHQMCSKKLTQKENVFWENLSHKYSTTVTSKYFNGFVYWAMTPTKIEVLKNDDLDLTKEISKAKCFPWFGWFKWVKGS